MATSYHCSSQSSGYYLGRHRRTGSSGMMPKWKPEGVNLSRCGQNINKQRRAPEIQKWRARRWKSQPQTHFSSLSLVRRSDQDSGFGSNTLTFRRAGAGSQCALVRQSQRRCPPLFWSSCVGDWAFLEGKILGPLWDLRLPAWSENMVAPLQPYQKKTGSTEPWSHAQQQYCSELPARGSHRITLNACGCASCIPAACGLQNWRVKLPKRNKSKNEPAKASVNSTEQRRRAAWLASELDWDAMLNWRGSIAHLTPAHSSPQC
jgi:hypothetical protein